MSGFDLKILTLLKWKPSLSFYRFDLAWLIASPCLKWLDSAYKLLFHVKEGDFVTKRTRGVLASSNNWVKFSRSALNDMGFTLYLVGAMWVAPHNGVLESDLQACLL